MNNKNTNSPPRGSQRGARFESVFLAYLSFLAAVAFGAAGFVTPPPGEIDESVLYMVAQLLILTASVLGVSAIFKDNIDKIKKLPSHSEEGEKQ